MARKKMSPVIRSKEAIIRNLKRDLKDVIEARAYWQRLHGERTNDFISVRDEVQRLARENNDMMQTISTLRTNAMHDANTLRSLSDKLEAMTACLREQDSTIEFQRARIEELAHEGELLRGQINTLQAHREALLDSMAVARTTLVNDQVAGRRPLLNLASA